jgi:uncharacterized protein YecE (DUF72 family)
LPLLIGTSGWLYKHWKGGFYPASTPQARWLEHYAARFDTVELNNSFYRLPDASAFETWERRLPEGFVVAVKASRYLTHVKRLRDADQPVKLLMQRAALLGGKLGPVLLQLPPNLYQDLDLLDATLAAFPDHVKVSAEFRHRSWFTRDCRRLLEKHGCALCIADGGAVDSPLWRTTDWGYVRFHSGLASPKSCYGRAALKSWAQRIGDTWGAEESVYVYFNNDLHGCAPRNARTFAAAATKAGLEPSRVPRRGEATLTT